jgi:heme O synthase-like polyprenyltransferase
VSDGATTEMRSATMSLAVGADIVDYLALLKPRVMSLVVFTGLVGMLLSCRNSPYFGCGVAFLHCRWSRCLWGDQYVV